MTKKVYIVINKINLKIIAINASNRLSNVERDEPFLIHINPEKLMSGDFVSTERE